MIKWMTTKIFNIGRQIYTIDKITIQWGKSNLSTIFESLLHIPSNFKPVTKSSFIFKTVPQLKPVQVTLTNENETEIVWNKKTQQNKN